MNDHTASALRDMPCDAFETQLLPIARLLVASLSLSDPTLWYRATREAVDIWGDGIGFPVAHGLGRIVIAVQECRSEKLNFRMPGVRHKAPDVTEDERHLLHMLHHMRRDNVNEARGAVQDLTCGLMAPDVIRAGLSFSHRFARGLERRRRSAPPVLSVVS